MNHEWLRRTTQHKLAWWILSALAWTAVWTTCGRASLAPVGGEVSSAGSPGLRTTEPKPAPAGRRHQLSRSDSIAVRFKVRRYPSQELRRLGVAPGPLEGYAPDTEAGEGVFILKATLGERERQRRDPTRLAWLLDRTRLDSSVQSVYPVLIEGETGQARIPTGEILICLRSEVDAQGYFGAAWTQTRRLRGSPDQFALTLSRASAEELIAEADRRAADPHVTWAQPNFLSQVTRQAGDPLALKQWALSNPGLNGATPGADVRAPGAWASSTGNPAIVIAVLDDGIQFDHPDLSSNIFSNPAESLNGLDDDHNGYVDDVHGWNFYRDDNDPRPGFAADNHGTAIAGLAAGTGAGGAGVAGVASGCQILPVKVLGGHNWAPDSALAEAIYYAAGRARDGLGTWRGADVISISLTFAQSTVVDDALAWASTNGRAGKGCPIFAAAGDDASRWQPARVRLPVGLAEGPGSYQFGFEYSKDVSSFEGEDLVKLDNIALLGADGVTQLDSAIGPGGRQDFEAVFPPPGWQLSASPGTAFWNPTTNGALTGTKGLVSARSGSIANNQWTELRTPVVPLAGNETLSFSCWISSEADYDGLRIWVYDAKGNYLDVFEGALGAPLISGNPPIASSIHYPASHPSVIAIGASTDSDVRADYSQVGIGLEMLAPSSGGWNDVIASDRTGADGYAAGDYSYDFGGTSAACPLAAAAGALVLSINPGLSSTEVRSILRQSCDKIGGVDYDGSGWNPLYGHGRLNAQAAVDAAKASSVVDLHLVVNPLPATVDPLNPFAFTLSVSNAGPALAMGVMLTNFLPANVTFVSSSPAAAEGSTPGIVVLNLGDMWVGAVSNVTIVTTPSVAGAITNLAMVTSSTPEAAPADNVAEAVTTVLPPFRVAIATPVDNAALLDPAQLMITALATDLDGRIAKVEFFSGDTKIGQVTNAPYVFAWTRPAHGHYKLSARVTNDHGDTRQSPVVAIDVVPGCSIGDVTVREGSSGITFATFLVRLSTPTIQPVTVNYSTADGSALVGADYVSTNGTLAFPPGTVVQTVRVGVKGNTLNQSNRTFLVNLANPVNAGIGDGQAVGTIQDDDRASLLYINDVAVTEGDSGAANALFTVRLSAPSGRTVLVNYRTTNGTALAGLDYTPVNGTLLFAPGVTNQTVSVPVQGDLLSENTETFFVNLFNPINALLGRGQGTGTILDNDPNPSLAISDATLAEGNRGTTNAVFNVSLSTPSGKKITVFYATASGTALAGRDFTPLVGLLSFAPGVTNQSVKVAVVGNTMSESNKTFTVNLSAPVNATIARSRGIGTILDDDLVPSLTIGDAAVGEGNRGPVFALFTVKLSASSGRPIRVDYATADGTALAGKDYSGTNGTLSFPPGTLAQTVRVAVNGNTLNQSNRTFLVNLSNPVNASIGDAQAAGTILDDDPASLLSINDVTVTEGDSGAANALFTVRLSAPSGRTVLVSYHTTNATALAGLDFTPVSGTLVFVPGATNQTVAVPVLGDLLNENTETFLVILSSPINALLGRGQGAGTILDNDPAPSLAIRDAALAAGSPGTTNAVFSVSLSAPSGKPISVGYATANGTALAGRDFTPLGGRLSFAPGVTNQSLTVVLIGSGLSESNRSFAVNLSAPVNATIARAHATATTPKFDFKILGLTVVRTNVLVNFSALSGRNCRVECLDGFPGGSNRWIPALGATNILARGSTATATNLGGAAQAGRFYRIRVLP